MRRQLLTALLVTVVLTVVLGIVYPLVVTGIAQVAFPYQAGGSLVKVHGTVVGSALIGQNFEDKSGNPLPQYFQPRPSAAGPNGYDPTQSQASNLGPGDPGLLKTVADRVAAYRKLNGLPATASVPVDAVTGSASGLDPDISEANALDQASRVAAARHLAAAQVVALVHSHTNGRPWGVLGEKTVNVLDLNLALDRLG